jgi:hypothetical protein
MGRDWRSNGIRNSASHSVALINLSFTKIVLGAANRE